MVFKKNRQPEKRERLAFMQAIECYKNIKPYLFAIEHGGNKNIREAVGLKRLGVRPGIPDYFFMFPNDNYHGLFIEFKAGNNNLTKAQKDFFDLAASVGYKCVVVWSWTEAIDEIKKYFNKM